jgi:glutathione S-transferase
MESRRSPQRQDPALIHRQEAKVAAALDFAESHMQDGEYLVGDLLTVADIAMAAALSYVDLRYAHEWRASRGRLAMWFTTFERRPSFVATMPS